MPNLHTKTQVLFAIYYSSVFIYLRHIYKEQICANPFFLFKKSSNAFILKAHVLPLYKFSSNIFKKLHRSCFGSCKFAPILFAYLTGFSASFDHKSTSELEKRFSLTSFYISWPPFWKLSSRWASGVDRQQKTQSHKKGY